MTDTDLTSQEQVNKSIGMCRLHGLHNTEATLRALSAERDALKHALVVWDAAHRTGRNENLQHAFDVGKSALVALRNMDATP